MQSSPARGRADSIALFAMVLPTLGAWIYFVVLAGSPAALPAYFASKVLQFALPLVFLLLNPGLRPTWVGARYGRREAVLLGMVSGLILGSALLAAYGVTFAGTNLAAVVSQKIQGKMSDFGIGTPLRYLAMALFLSTVHALYEEWYWRWFVFDRLNAYLSTPWAALWASLAFASHHVIVVANYLPPERFWDTAAPASAGVAVGGVLWCWMYRRSGGLLAPWLSHLWVDVALMGMGAWMIWS